MSKTHTRRVMFGYLNSKEYFKYHHKWYHKLMTEEDYTEPKHPQLEAMMRYFGAMSVDSAERSEKFDNKIDFKVAKILNDLNPGEYNIGIGNGFFQALVKLAYTETPQAGLKIHISVDLTDSYYLDIVKAVVSTCSNDEDEGMPTSFKIMTASSQRSARSSGSKYIVNQGLKTITIYPRYIVDNAGNVSKTNVPETVRIMKEINSKLAKYQEQMKGKSIEGDLEVFSGIFIRPGPFTREGVSLATSNRYFDFGEQLNRLMVNPEDFKNELRDAGIYP